MKNLIQKIRSFFSLEQHKDLNFLPYNKPEDLHALLIAVLRELAFLGCLPEEAKTAEIKYKIQTMIGWKNIIVGALMDAAERESQEWVEKSVREIFEKAGKATL